MHIPFIRKNHIVTIVLDTIKKPLTFKSQRLFLWLFLIPVTLLSACSTFNANANNYPITPPDIDSRFMQINILNSFLLKSKKINSLPVTELSDLAWDADEQLLYAISDEGLLYHLKLEIKNKQLQSVEFVSAMPLSDKKNAPLKGRKQDAEGLSLINANNGKQGDSQLLISFENKPRIAIHDTKGRFLKNIKTPKRLSKRKYYRGGNKALESVSIHPQHGILTASERPLKAKPLSTQTIYSATGKEWNFAASKIKNSSITSIEVMSKDKLLILERAYNGLLSPVVISLRELSLKNCGGSQLCETRLIAKFDSSEGWTLDNFEGLTRIQDNQYLMVSDNNNNPLQKTLLVLFETLDK